MHTQDELFKFYNKLINTQMNITIHLPALKGKFGHFSSILNKDNMESANPAEIWLALLFALLLTNSSSKKEVHVLLLKDP